MERPDPEQTVRRLVRERFPDARQAWLSGSVVLGSATATSDLDVPVLRDEGEVFRESLEYDGWPVELFVHTPASMRWFVAKDLERRQPSMARMVASGVPLLAGDGGAELEAECRATLAAGPPPLSDDDLALLRYTLTDLLDDLAGVDPGPVRTAVAVSVWRETAELALATAGAWQGSGKWLLRELATLDERTGGDLAGELDAALTTALAGDPTRLTAAADRVLDGVGGRLWTGLRLNAPPLD
jgi:Nucleotidyltransferase domain